jgi:hypothetical protein
MTLPTQSELADAIADATRRAVSNLFQKHPGHFYYCALITTGEAHRPFVTAWSEEALNEAALRDREPVKARELLKWSHADSPYCCFGDEHFSTVATLFDARPSLDGDNWRSEWQFRVDAMEAALSRLDREGLFGRGAERSRIFVNVEVMPPDYTNVERAARLNPSAAMRSWLQEAAEP